MPKTDLDKKIRHALTEARVVLPGTQALLGFQGATTLTDAFAQLPLSSKYVHLASLCAVTLSVLLLMTPAALHRIVERGEDTERVHRVTGACVLLALPPLALAMGGELFVVVRKVTGTASVGILAAVVMVVALLGGWFALPLAIRARDRGKMTDRRLPARQTG